LNFNDTPPVNRKYIRFIFIPHKKTHFITITKKINYRNLENYWQVIYEIHTKHINTSRVKKVYIMQKQII